MKQYFIEPRTRIYVKGYGFLSFARILFDKYVKQLLNTATKKPADKAGEFLWNRNADTLTNSYKIVKTKPI